MRMSISDLTETSSVWIFKEVYLAALPKIPKKIMFLLSSLSNNSSLNFSTDIFINYFMSFYRFFVSC